MRVLCLHPEASSALSFSKHLSKLEERLWEKHGIELYFVDAPLLDVNRHDDEQCAPSRRWYVQETISTNDTSTVKYSGLDASLLHLSQIWARGGANSSNQNGVMGECLSFQGILGFGQGANIGAMLPLLSYNYNEEEDEKKIERPPIFQGLQFIMIVDGVDLVHQDNAADEIELDTDLYVGEEGVQSLHVIFDNKSEECKSNSTRLAKQYGPNAEIHHCKQTDSTTCAPALSNILGKYLVSQKNKLYGNSETRQLIALQNRLANVEQLATLAIAQEIQRNPPKALMAVIGPVVNNEKENEVDVGMAMGAWQGPRRRGFGEEGGGAPCPEEFLLKENERG
ncbi:hypothetical protein ACHAWO_008111 [Cyclotella atomus]|uniref:Serine hydrolase domain-containing protein n=1 Tax=Cyclotella atomus TaxID=382360 RepID=A0ABD3Q798_9STRA